MEVKNEVDKVGFLGNELGAERTEDQKEEKVQKNIDLFK